jgi:hypothetical protein
MNGRASLESSTDVSSSPPWLAADLVEKAKMGRVHIRNYKNGLIQVNRLGTLRERKRKLSQM